MSTKTIQPEVAEQPRTLVHAAMTVNDAVQLYPDTLPVFRHYRIDACCGGARRIDDVAQRHGIELNALLEVLNWAAAGLRLDHEQ